jgi:iron(III) transport system permease protein
MLVALEERNRRGTADSSDLTQASRINLTGAKAGLAIAACLAPVMLGFAIPLTTLLIYASEHLTQNTSANFARMAVNSVSLALTASIAITLIAWLLAYTKRMYPSPLNNSLIRVSTIGYALPGILLAVALLKPLGAVNHWLVDIWPNGTEAIFTGGVFLLLYAYVCRFLTVAYQSLESGFTSISTDLDAAARTLGASTLGLSWRIHLPLLKPSILGACLLVFVDVMRELPATLILRPFNFNTLATHVYRLASDERLNEASLAAALIVVVGVIPVVLLQRSGSSRATPGA